MVSVDAKISSRWGRWIAAHPVASYFLLTFTISWTGALMVVAPRIVRSEAIPKFTGLMIFPVLLLGPSISGIVLTSMVSGSNGLRDLFARMHNVRVPVSWYGALLIPPVLILCVLLGFKVFVSQIFTPNLFFIGIGFGVIAGFAEEVGWTGFAFPALVRRRDAFPSAVVLGLLWGLWHLPAIDYLGSATPHGSFFVPYFLVFTAAMVAMRVLISWVYTNTGSVLLAQLLHASSTASLVVLSPAKVTAAQETLWYGAYALVLWIVVAAVFVRYGKDLKGSRATFVGAGA